MNKTQEREGDPPLEAHARRGGWIGLVWAVPLAALIIVAFLGVRAIVDRGIEVVVTFETAAGARVDDTKVLYLGVEAGKVTKIKINDDAKHVDLTLRLDSKAERGLTTNTKFWLVGAKPNLGDFASVKAAVAGLTIGVAPGVDGQPTRHFIGLSEPPKVLPGTRGTGYRLVGESLATTQAGSAIFFHGQKIGIVTAIAFVAPTTFQMDIFVFAPFDALVHSSSNFWISSPVQLSLTSDGADAHLEHAGGLLTGAIELDTFDSQADASQSAEGSRFKLYVSRDQAEAALDGPQVPYAFAFHASAGELKDGAAVRMLGFRIGQVNSVKLQFDDRTGKASTLVVASLYPRKLHVVVPPGSDAAMWRRATDAAINRLLAQGFLARVAQMPPFIGGQVIDLERGSGHPPASLQPGKPAVIPSLEGSGGLEPLIAKADAILGKVNDIPFEAIAKNVRQSTEHINRLVSSPQLAHSVQALDGTLSQADQLLEAVRPQVGPLLVKLNDLADQATSVTRSVQQMVGDEGAGTAPHDATIPDALHELTEATRSIRVLTDYLARHPDSLIRGRGRDSAETPGTETR